MSAVSKPNLLFPPFLRRKTNLEGKTSKMPSVSTPSFKRNLIQGNVSERQNMRLFWNKNKLTPVSFFSLRPQCPWQIHLHALTVTCRRADMAMLCSWGSHEVWCEWWSRGILMCSVLPRAVHLSRSVLVHRLEPGTGAEDTVTSPDSLPAAHNLGHGAQGQHRLKVENWNETVQ